MRRLWLSAIGSLLLSFGLMPATVGHAGGAASKFKLKDGDTIVFLGDSITQGGGRPEGYVTLFQAFCGVNGYEVKVINSGISGHKSNDMLARLQRDVLDHKPTWVSISCGVNDVWHGAKGVSLPDYKKNMTEMIDRCRAAGAKVVLLTSTPIREKLDNPENKKLAEYNAFLRDLAKEKKLVLCDLNKVFTEWYGKKLNDNLLMTTDGVHMNGRGNRLMAREIIKALGASPQEIRRSNWRWELPYDYPVPSTAVRKERKKQ